MDAIEFGQFLKAIRKEKGITLNQLGHTTGLSQPYLSQIENGKKGIPSPEVLKKLALNLDIDYDELSVHAGITDGKSIKIKQMSYAASIIIDTILSITESAKTKYPNMNAYINYIENFEEHLEIGRSGGEASINDLKRMLWRLEGDEDSYESLIGSRSDARKIEGLLDALSDVLEDSSELNITRNSTAKFKELILYLDQTDITYNGHVLTEQDKHRVLDVLKILFPNYIE
ncbi:HTH-type transcriptional repressor RghR [compost metagenome]